jgi:hypothetical protein
MASSLPIHVSASKLRRIRGAATKLKLYEASQQPNVLSMVCSQLAMLTTTVDTLISILSHGHQFQGSVPTTGCMTHLDAKAAEFVPSASALQKCSETSKSTTTLEEPPKSDAESDVRQLSICKSTGQSHCLWQPCPKSRFIQPGSLTHMELENDAATVVQKWYRALNSSVTEGSDHDGSERESVDNGGGNCAEQLSVRRAFLLCNTTAAPSAQRPGDSSDDAWTTDQVMRWLGNAIDRACEPEDKVQGARTMWSEWASASPYLPDDMQQSIVRLIDQKLRSTGFPSLRELVQLQDG